MMNTRILGLKRLGGALAAAAFAGVAGSTALGETKETFNKTYPAASGGKLVVDVDFGSLDIKAGTAEEIKIHVERSVSAGSKQKEENFLYDRPIEVTQDGSTLTIRSVSAKKSQTWNWGRLDTRARYTIEVPSRFDTKAHTSGGGIEVSGIKGENQANTSGGGLKFRRLEGDLKVHTSGGGIDLEECKGTLKVNTSGGGIKVVKSSGKIEAKTSGGSIRFDGFEGPVDVDTSGGGLHLDGIAGMVRGRTSGGSIQAQILGDKPEADLSTSAGGIKLRVDASAAFNLDASTSAGNVSCDLPMTAEAGKQDGKLRGTVNGGGAVVKLRSSAGGIHIVK